MKRPITHHAAVTAAAVAAAMAVMPAAAETPSLSHTTILSGLENPWDMAFLDDGTMFFTEKCKGLSVRMPSGDVTALLGMTGTTGYAATAVDLFCEGQAGMMGVEVDPGFAENRTLYVYSTSSLTAPGTNRLMKLTLSEDMSTVTSR
ncbi:MAG: PQQ-dependent sugar dehydrogenase, partial [Pseudomonadota bacterium]